MKILLPLVAFLTLSGVAAAQSLDVAIVASADSNDGSCHFIDPRDKLLATGMFDSVDVINTYSVTPTLQQLLSYDAVICWTSVTPKSNKLWGDVMADYVDAGGGVVVTVFANTTTTPGRYLAGRWVTGGYEVIVSRGGTLNGQATLGVVHDPTHPTMAGIATFDGGSSSFRPVTSDLTPGSAVIAEWSDGKILVAEGANPRRIDLGMYPPSADCLSISWDPATDGALLLANALAYVANGPVGAPYCFCDGTGSSSPCGNLGTAGNGCANSASADGGNLAATGLASVSDSSVVLLGSNGVPNESGLYFQANNRINGGIGVLWGDGLRCAGGGLIRLQVRFNDAGGLSSTSIDIAAKGNVAAGETKRYQFWYRDPIGSPCANEFNTTNGLEIVWGP